MKGRWGVEGSRGVDCREVQVLEVLQDLDICWAQSHLEGFGSVRTWTQHTLLPGHNTHYYLDTTQTEIEIL